MVGTICGFVEGVDAVVQKIDNVLQRFVIFGLMIVRSEKLLFPGSGENS